MAWCIEFIGELDTDEPVCPLLPPGTLIMSGFAGQPPFEPVLTPPRPVPFFFPLGEFPQPFEPFEPSEVTEDVDDIDDVDDTEDAPDVRWEPLIKIRATSSAVMELMLLCPLHDDLGPEWKFGGCATAVICSYGGPHRGRKAGRREGGLERKGKEVKGKA